jgi:hypothetical protein
MAQLFLRDNIPKPLSLNVVRRKRHIWEDNIRRDIQETEWERRELD